MRRIRLLIVDDAVVVRSLLSKVFSEDPQLEVVGSAASGRIALAMLAQTTADLVLLDVGMPDMDGLETLSIMRRQFPRVPVMMFSGQTERGAQVTLEALALGAVDYFPKPQNMGSAQAVRHILQGELVPKIKAIVARLEQEALPALPAAAVPLSLTTSLREGRETPLLRNSRAPATSAPRLPIEVVAIGTSTGGPSALARLLPALPRGFPVPIVIVQHMPPIFTRLLAERLVQKSAISVVEAADGDPLLPGKAFIAPGNFHMLVAKSDGVVRVQLNQNPPENSCRPAVDVLFRSVAEIYQSRTLAVVLTGMGQDGTQGCEVIRRVGGQVVAQDEATSVVWGMPRFVVSAGYAERVLPLDQIAAEIVRRTMEGRQG